MNSINYIGLDIHKKRISCCMRQADGMIIQESTIAATRDTLDDWMRQLPPGGESAVLANNSSLNIIYMCDACSGFVSVLDAIQGDGFNPLWQEVQIQFNPGFTPHELTSDTDILEAEASGEITLTPTNEVYRCSVIGKK